MGVASDQQENHDFTNIIQSIYNVQRSPDLSILITVIVKIFLRIFTNR